MNAFPPSLVFGLLTALPLAAQVGIPTTPKKFDTERIGEALSGGSSVGVSQTPRQPATVRTVTHIVLGEPRQWKMSDGKSFVGKLIAFEDIVIQGTAGAPLNVPKKPTVVRNATARFYVDSKVYELALDKLGAEERKFIEDTAAAIAAKK
jgi:hypothetical protein